MDAKIKMKEINIGTEGQPNMARIGYYWSDQQTTKIIELLKEYLDAFVGDYKDLKGLVEEMEEMKIDLLLEATLVKKTPYNIAHKYKAIIKT